MNAEPHTHTVQVRSNSVLGWVTYGDTHIIYGKLKKLRKMSPEMVAEKVRAAALEAIKRHDEGSRREGMIAAAVKEINEVVTTVRNYDTWTDYEDRTDAWGLDLLNQ